MRAALFAAHVALFATAATAQPALQRVDLGPLPFELEADRFTAEPGLGVFTAEGRAALHREGLTLFADRLFFDRRTGAVVAEGHVVAVEGSSVLTCDRVVLRMDDLTGAIDRADLRVKRGRARTTSATAAIEHGDDLMRLRAARVERTGLRELSVEDVDFTPCRCAPGDAPDWKLSASSAEVDVDSGAWLFAPVLEIKDVPVLILPVLYVPLGERRTGLLLPRVDYTSKTGLQLTLPMYVTLGRSFDVTADASWWLDRGPAPAVELRWAPAGNHRGELRTTVLLDRGVARPDGRYDATRDTILPRFAITGRHRGRSGPLTVAADLNIAGDLAFIGEFGVELFERQAEEAVSRVTIARDFGPILRASGGVALRQDLRVASYPMREARLVSLFDPDYATLGRFAELRMDALPHRLLDGPWSPLGSARLIVDALGDLELARATTGRADLRPALTIPIGAHGLSLTSEAALRLTGASRTSDVDPESDGRVAPIFRTTAAIELHRRFANGLTHVLRPRVTHLAIPIVEGPAEIGAPDDIGLLREAHQLAFTLENELFLSGLPRRLAWLDATLGQDLRAPDNRTLLVRAQVELPLPGSTWTAQLTGRSEVVLDDDPRLAEIRVGTTWRRAGTLDLSLLYADLDDLAPRTSVIDPEHVVASIDDRPFWTAFRGVVGGVGVRPIDPLRLDASVAIDALADEPLRLVRGAIGWTSPCDCWSARVVVAKARDRELPDFHLTFDLSQLGGTE